MKNTKSKSNQSVYRNQNIVIRSIFEQAGSPKKVLCVALDYAKNKHVALCCDGNGEILKNSFPIENTVEGVAFLSEQIAATARKRKIAKKCIFLGGEDEPAYVSNFAAALRKRGYVIARVNALEAKKNRENFLATTDDLDLLGIAKTLLSRRARIVSDESSEEEAIYRRIRSLTRARRGLVRQKTAASNRIHSSADILFPDFLNASKSGVTPFSSVSLKLMENRFSAPQISRRKQSSLADFLRKNHSKHPDEGASKLIELARKALPPQACSLSAMQSSLTATVDLYTCLDRNAKSLRIDAALELASTPYVMLTSIPGISFVLAAGVAGELGNPKQLGSTDSLCSYAGIIPSVYQSGGPDSPPRHSVTSPRCNRILKDWVVQSSQKIALYGPPELKDRMLRWQINGQHAAFAGARRYLRLLRTLVRSEVPYLDPSGRGLGSDPKSRAAACEKTWEILRSKWRVIPNWREAVFAEDKPLGFWRKVAMEMFDAHLPLGK